MNIEQSRYLAYLLRLWQIKENGHLTWHASLEDSHTGQRYGFADLEKLFHFLKQETEEVLKEEARK